eukprot:Lankesteria_metandrocarpae@DN1674_c0_g1_i2.p1
MIYIFLLVLPLLVTVPTMAMESGGGGTKGVGGRRRSRFGGKVVNTADSKLSDTERSRKVNAYSTTTTTQESAQKAAAFLELMDLNRKTKDIVRNPTVDTSEAMINVSRALAFDPKVDTQDQLREYIKSMLTERFTDYLDAGANAKGVDPVSVAGSQNTLNGLTTPLDTPYLKECDGIHHNDRTSSSYVVTIFKDQLEFEAHKFTPCQFNSGLLSGVVVPVRGAFTNCTAEEGVFAFTPESGYQRKSHECVLHDALVSEDGCVQVYIFHWIHRINTSGTYDDWDEVKKVVSLSKGAVRYY